MEVRWQVKLVLVGATLEMVIVGLVGQLTCRTVECRDEADEWATSSVMPEQGPQPPMFGTNQPAIVGTILAN